MSLALGAAEKPNFIFLFSDDQQADTIGAWGNPRIETPNLDRMVGEGFSFRSAYRVKIHSDNHQRMISPDSKLIPGGKTLLYSHLLVTNRQVWKLPGANIIHNS